MLEPYLRGHIWWVRGTVTLNGRDITPYYRCSTGASAEAGARDWIRAEEARQIRRHLVGDEAALTFAEAVLLYPAKPAEAKALMKVMPELGEMAVVKITPQIVRNLGPKLMPACATDTWQRQIIVPVSAVINNAHDLGRCPPIRIRGYSSQDRIAQDQARGKLSRQERTPGSWEWLHAFRPHAGPYLAALAEFMFETGARVGQAVALRPRDLDLMRGRVWMPASKGHAAQWVSISPEMVVTLANLKPKPPRRSTETRPALKVFGYAASNGPLKAWRAACTAAGIAYLPPHSAGRHGFYTELRMRQGVDPITAAKAGRWANAALPDKIYAHVEGNDREARTQIRTGSVQTSKPLSDKVLISKG
jgi:integrase